MNHMDHLEINLVTETLPQPRMGIRAPTRTRMAEVKIATDLQDALEATASKMITQLRQDTETSLPAITVLAPKQQDMGIMIILHLAGMDPLEGAAATTMMKHHTVINHQEIPMVQVETNLALVPGLAAAILITITPRPVELMAPRIQTTTAQEIRLPAALAQAAELMTTPMAREVTHPALAMAQAATLMITPLAPGTTPQVVMAQAIAELMMIAMVQEATLLALAMVAATPMIMITPILLATRAHPAPTEIRMITTIPTAQEGPVVETSMDRLATSDHRITRPSAQAVKIC